MKKIILSLCPFFLFFMTYLFLIYYYQYEKIIVPNLVGSNFIDIVHFDNNFSFKIYKVTTDKKYPHNYIISQYPKGGTIMKNNYNINIEVNFNQNIKKFDFKNKSCKSVIDFLKKEGMNYKILPISLSNFKFDIIIASKYSNWENLFYLYHNISGRKEEFGVRNCLMLNCKDFFNVLQENIKFSCYDKFNFDINECPGGKIVSQYPLPGIYKKEDFILSCKFWHDKFATQHNI